MDEGRFWFNTDAEGLKRIHKPNAPRPLLGSVAAVRDWLKYHPHADDGDAHLIMGKPKYGNPDPYEPVSHRTVQRVMDSVKEDAEINKPLHPHACRHNAVSIWVRDYHMDDQTVKFLIGHSPDSTVMESTYSHLSAEDHIQAAEEAAGVREEESQSPYSRDYCDLCDNPLPTDAKACPRCGTAITPDAHHAQEMIDEAIHQSAKEATTDAEKAELDELRRVIKENPQVVDYLDDERLAEVLGGE